MSPAQSPSQAVAQQQAQGGGVVDLVRRYQDRFTDVLPEHIRPETFIGLAVGMLHRDPKLAAVANRNAGSFLATLLDCARLGHEPGSGLYHFVPFGNEIQGIEDYKGEIERIYRAGAVSTIKADVVRENDLYEFDETLSTRPKFLKGFYVPGQESGRHQRFLGKAERGELVGVFAYAEFPNGATSRVVEMGRAEVMEHKAASKSSGGKDSPWNKWEASMWLKTSVHELKKWVPTSSEYRRQVAEIDARAQAVGRRIAGEIGSPAPLLAVAGQADVPEGVNAVTGEIEYDPEDPTTYPGYGEMTGDEVIGEERS